MNIISFLVDALPEHYFKAELLLHSIDKFAQQPKEHILVQCVNRVDDSFLAFLRNQGYRYELIEPYLDGKYCNKIPQLDAFTDSTPDGVFLLDTDMFVLCPLAMPDSQHVWGKIVDAPNPPLPILENIFSAAGLKLPNEVATDWSISQKTTIDCNFNGGFYYIPGNYINLVAAEWKKWATWLYNKPEMFENPKQYIHVDQIAMGLGLIAGNVPYKSLPSNYNCPTHESMPQRSFSPDQQISILHYHREITPFGTLNKGKAANKPITDAIENANRSIAAQGDFVYFRDYKKYQVKQPAVSDNTRDLDKAFSELTKSLPKRVKLILHAGTPKTGTTSLQLFMDNHRSELKESGYLYPMCQTGATSPKHQWLVSNLLTGNAGQLLTKLHEVIEQFTDNIHTIILSSEGIYNHWWDLAPEAKYFLHTLTRHFDVVLWVWFREPFLFIESLYKQFIRNPQATLPHCFGRDLSFIQMLEDDWFSRQLDYLGFICECEQIFGNKNIEVFTYMGDTVTTACNNLGFMPVTKNIFRENIGQSSAAIELIRIINRYPLNPSEKTNAVTLVSQLDDILSKYTGESLPSEKEKNMVFELSSLQKHVLSKNYNLAF